MARYLCVVTAMTLLLYASVATPAVPDAARDAAPDDETARLISDLGLREAATPLRTTPGWRAPKSILVRRLRPDVAAWLQPLVPGARITVVSTPEEAVRAAPDAEVILGLCSNELIASHARLRWVQSFKAGVEDCVGAPAVREGRVLLTNTQRTSGPMISEYAIGMLLALSRGLPQFAAQQREGRWDEAFADKGGMQLMRGKTLLVVGLGGIGTEVARLANALGMKVIGTRNSSRDAPPFVSYVGLANEMPMLARQADAIVNATPLTPATTGIFNAAFFASLKPTAYFVNVGRGGSVISADLDAALRAGRLAGAAIDVTDPEPLPADNPLWHAPNLIITPHVSGASEQDYKARELLVRENLRRYAAGDRMLSVVEAGRGY